jgi:asparagine synthase (glutamine-hydrolysing)
MCGIYFYFSKTGRNNLDFESMNFLSHRGPDEQSIEKSSLENSTIYGFTRLSIRAISNGHQPYWFKNNVSLINGELFNELSVKKDLLSEIPEDQIPKGDMQVLGLALMLFGPEYLSQCIGQFAGVIHQALTDEIVLFRDTMGEKPLFYRIVGNDILEVSSEFRFVYKHEGLPTRPSIRRSDALFGYYESRHDSHIHEVEPGSFIIIKLENFAITKFSYSKTLLRPKSSNGETLEARLDNFESAVISAVDSQLIADEGVEVLLSGGIDSSLILFLANKISPRRVVSFTIGFEDKSYDESLKASEFSKYLGVENRTLIFKNETLVNSIPQIIEFMDVPILDPACIPLFNLLQHVSSFTKCAMTGDGGDEISRGYSLFQYLRLIEQIERSPKIMRTLFSKIINQKIYEIDGNYQGISFKLKRLADIISNDHLPKFKTALSPFAGTPIFKAMSLNLYPIELKNNKLTEDALESHYLNSILPNIYLRKSDRMGMANGVELRAPFLDKRVVSTAFNFSPSELKKLGAKGPLTYLATKYLPAKISNQKKHGFSFKFNELKKYLLEPRWSLDELGLSKRLCSHVWNSEVNNYNYSLTNWALYVLNELKLKDRIEFLIES